jgi:hypothetical protein
MSERWEETFAANQLLWGREPARAALVARDLFVRQGAREILVPGMGLAGTRCPFSRPGWR